jgi:predicted DNA repair protein MutK
LRILEEIKFNFQAWWRGVSCRSKLSKRSKTEKQHIQQNILCETEKENETNQCSFISQNEIMVKAVAHTPPQPQNEAAETTDQTQCQQVEEVEVIIVEKDLIQLQEQRSEATIKIQVLALGLTRCLPYFFTATILTFLDILLISNFYPILP